MKLISWFKRQLFRNALDELQQQKADRIGHRGYWLAWWLLLAALLGQSIAGAEMPQMAGEWVIFMVLNFYGLIEWLRNGIWTISDARPTLAKNAVWSAAAGVGFFLYLWARNSRQDWWQPGYWWSAALGGVVVFALCLGALQLSAALYYKRRHALDDTEETADKEKDD